MQPSTHLALALTLIIAVPTCEAAASSRVISVHRQATARAVGSAPRGASLVPACRRRSSAVAALSPQATRDSKSEEDALRRRRRYINLTGFPFPLGPLFERATIRTEVKRDRVWSFEQEQSLGFGDGATIAANARMTVVRLESGGLWVLNPVAPTRECLDLLEELGGPVEHVVLGTTQYEHKVFVPAFSRRFPRAQVWVAPDQWAFPLDLPLPLLGLAGAKVLDDRARAPSMPSWARELPFSILRPHRRLGLGYAAVEVAFGHLATRSLLVTDSLLFVPRDPPEVLSRDNLRGLGEPGNIVSKLAAATNWRGEGDLIRKADAADAERGTSDAVALRRGWQRNAVLSLFFGPAPDAIAEPTAAFNAISGRWLVGPVCSQLIYSSEPVRAQLRGWISDIAGGKLGRFDTIIPAHFAARRGTPTDVRRAFAPVIDVRAMSSVSPLAALEAALPVPGPRGVSSATALSREGYREGDVKLLADIGSALRVLRVI
mmetsp:Transcript_13033/g.39274  ORF Transcript_13033/g.39274 Transcript_13033/m.39274 type:complete len:489 (-) Transcript_13033:178-1644(-)